MRRVMPKQCQPTLSERRFAYDDGSYRNPQPRAFREGRHYRKLLLISGSEDELADAHSTNRRGGLRDSARVREMEAPPQ